MAPKLQNSQPEESERSCKGLTEKLNHLGQNINNISDAPTDSDDSDRPLVKRVKVIRQVGKYNDLSDNTSDDSDSDAPIVQRVRDKCQVGKRNNPKENNPNNDTDDPNRPIMQRLIVKHQAGKDSSDLNDDSDDADESLMENHACLALAVDTTQRLNKEDGDDNNISLAESVERRHRSFGSISTTTNNTQNKEFQISSKRADQDNLDKGSSQTSKHAKRIIERDDCDEDIDIIAINPQLTHPGNISSLNIPEKILSIAKPREGNSPDTISIMTRTPKQSRPKSFPLPNTEIIEIDSEDNINDQAHQSVMTSKLATANSIFSKTESLSQPKIFEDPSQTGKSPLNEKSTNSKENTNFDANYASRESRLSTDTTF